MTCCLHNAKDVGVDHVTQAIGGPNFSHLCHQRLLVKYEDSVETFRVNASKLSFHPLVAPGVTPSNMIKIHRLCFDRYSGFSSSFVIGGCGVKSIGLCGLSNCQTESERQAKFVTETHYWITVCLQAGGQTFEQSGELWLSKN